MNVDEFWVIIDRVHSAHAGDMDAKCEALGGELRRLDDAMLRGFISRFDEANDRAYDWKLWGAAYLIGGGCSDDAFSDFRSTLISMGRRFYQAALADPDNLASQDYEEEAFYEGFQYVKNQVARERFGEIPKRSVPFPKDPTGENWEEDDLPRLLPRLAKKFGG